ncbi:hypothetical protein ACFX11_025411 [Malus domestica]
MEATKKAEDLVENTWQHLKTSLSFTDAAMGRIAQGTKVLVEGGYEKILPFVDGERLVEEREYSPLPSCVSNGAGAEHCSGGQKPISDSSRQQGPSSQGSKLALLLVPCCHSCRVHEEEGCVSEAAFIWLVFCHYVHGGQLLEGAQNGSKTVARFEEYMELVNAQCVADRNEIMQFHCLGLTSSGVKKARYRRQDTLKARAQSAKTATKVSEMVGNVNTSNALSAFDKMEEKGITLISSKRRKSRAEVTTIKEDNDSYDAHQRLRRLPNY